MVVLDPIKLFVRVFAFGVVPLSAGAHHHHQLWTQTFDGFSFGHASEASSRHCDQWLARVTSLALARILKREYVAADAWVALGTTQPEMLWRLVRASNKFQQASS